MWKEVFLEDIEGIEGIQAGRMAPSYDGEKFSAVMDFLTYHFHKWVAQRMMRTGQDDTQILMEQFKKLIK